MSRGMQAALTSLGTSGKTSRCVRTAASRRCLVALACVVALLGQHPRAAEAESAPISVLQFNVCGKACGTGNAVVSDLEDVIRASSPRPYVLMLNEMCRSGYTRLTIDMPEYHGHFQTTIAGGCQDGSDYGDAVLLRSATFTTLGSWTLPRPAGGEVRQMTCLKKTLEGSTRPLVACGTHIDYQAGNTAQQISAVATRAAGYASTNAVVVGGDFNTTPSTAALDTMYTSSYVNGRGKFVEADAMNYLRTGGTSTSTYNQHTGCGGPSCPSTAHPARRKIDDVFVSSGAFSGISARVHYTAHSDHRPVVATVVVR